MSRVLSLAASAIVLAGSAGAASLLGTSVTLNYTLGATTTTDVLTVGAGPEVTCTGGGAGNANVCTILTAPTQTVDIGALSIGYAYSGTGSAFNNLQPNGFDFEGLNPGAPITAVALTTNISGLDAGRVTFTGSSIQVDMHGLSLPGPQSSFTLDITAGSAVPEPAGLWLGVGGLAGLAMLRGRRSR